MSKVNEVCGNKKWMVNNKGTIAWEPGLVNSLHCLWEKGGLDCCVITTEYLSCIQWIHM
mgnify:CR=1 FL=1